MDNFARMMQLADEVFAVHDDPTQLQVDQDVLEQLQHLHPASVGQQADAIHAYRQAVTHRHRACAPASGVCRVLPGGQCGT